MEIKETLNEEVIEEVIGANSGRYFKKIAGVGVTLVAGGLAYKYVVKPTVDKIKIKKAKKNQPNQDNPTVNVEEQDID